MESKGGGEIRESYGSGFAEKMRVVGFSGLTEVKHQSRNGGTDQAEFEVYREIPVGGVGEDELWVERWGETKCLIVSELVTEGMDGGDKEVKQESFDIL